MGIVFILISTSSWSISLGDTLKRDLFNMAVNKNRAEAQSLVNMNCRDASSRIARLTLNTSQEGGISDSLDLVGLLLAMLRESHTGAYNEGKQYILNDDVDSLTYMFDFEARGTGCNDKRTLKQVIRSAYTPV